MAHEVVADLIGPRVAEGIDDFAENMPGWCSEFEDHFPHAVGKNFGGLLMLQVLVGLRHCTFFGASPSEWMFSES